MNSSDVMRVGRFAPSPSGRMHLGNLFTALMSWLSVKSRGGRWILRIEDLDPQRSKEEYAAQIEDDLLWLGLEWDEGGIAGKGNHGPYLQSRRYDKYGAALHRLAEQGLLYPCTCRRADILATQAPHQSDGRIVYAGTCRPAEMTPLDLDQADGKALRLKVEDKNIRFVDKICGPQSVNLADHCGDFVVRRADGAWGYQLAVVVDDADMGVTEVMRGDDLLLSTAQQLYLYDLLGLKAPDFAHLPLVRNAEGVRLSKRDKAMNMEYLRQHHTPEQILGKLARIGGLIEDENAISLSELLEIRKKSLIS